jgi:hypothetical protein
MAGAEVSRVHESPSANFALAAGETPLLDPVLDGSVVGGPRAPHGISPSPYSLLVLRKIGCPGNIEDGHRSHRRRRLEPDKGPSVPKSHANSVSCHPRGKVMLKHESHADQVDADGLD